MFFCCEREIDQYKPSVNNVIAFLTKLHQQGVGYSALNTAKSVVSSVVNLISNYQIGTHPLVKQFMKGVFHKNPSLPRNLFTWDVSRVLVYLRSLWPPSTLSLNLLKNESIRVPMYKTYIETKHENRDHLCLLEMG